MKDIQKTVPIITIPIMRVGIQNFKLPIFVLEMLGSVQHTVADVDVFVNLDKNKKGIHMSRLIECAHKTTLGILSDTTIELFARDILVKSEADRAEIIFRFPYFIKKQAPISKMEGFVHANVEISFVNYLNHTNESFLKVEMLTTSLCPCSKEISKFGAHNQRSRITVSGKNKNKNKIWIEDVIKIIEENSSSQMYSILKRPDEKFVTEQAYENPKFVEDSSRQIFQTIYDTKRFSKFKVKVVNEESIHMHNAVAIIEYNGEK